MRVTLARINGDHANNGRMNEMTCAERNRLIKKLLTRSFGNGVTVHGSRGTAYGWVRVNIPYAPKTYDHRNEIERKIWQLFDAAKIDIGTFGYDDPGSDYGYGRKINFSFLPVLEKRPGEL